MPIADYAEVFLVRSVLGPKCVYCSMSDAVFHHTCFGVVCKHNGKRQVSL